MSDEALDAPAWLRQLLREAEARGASDIHLQRTGRGASVAFRLDGVLAPVPAVPEELADRLFGRIKFLARLKTYEESLPQDGRIDANEAGTTNDVRVATYPTVTGEKIVLRLFQASAGQGLAELGFSQRLTEELKQVLGLTTGLPENRAVELASGSVANACFGRRAAAVQSDLAAGVKLPEALRRLDPAGELTWRLRNATQSRDGFLAALAGWHEALEGRAFAQEQIFAQSLTSALVVVNGVFVALLAIGVFQMFTRLTHAALMS